ncbi:MAG: NGG1p interacting factor NIF3 [Gammaproteobacteria bacterium]|nr:MAG: NGG1p interacting factor NIF3 [Gammaproteobacteria bacterium]
MYKLVFYVPVDHVESVKRAVFDSGAGRIGNYDCCCWQVLGTGQFRPLSGSDPFIGNSGELATVEEYRVELVCDDHLIQKAVAALVAAHPYEEPAYDVWKLAKLPL